MEAYLINLDWNQIISFLIKIGVTFILALPIAWEREIESRSMGLRTFPLVAVASCGYLLVGLQFAPDNDQAQARILQGLITGMGFIGGGAILKTDGGVKGTATAASVWTTGIIGAAVAYDAYGIAILISAINFVVLRLFTQMKSYINNGS